ncbi:MAG: 2-oxoacid:acceptor oxidoreductase family protein [Candidatus Jordarchaeum sp.]|uniref:2-oxoacid:acceptor oxidoreductase family protein n=1 Tax=Candidatus Jordarchaeum sp. TaxID=2823881 RepID=UPI0040490CDC
MGKLFEVRWHGRGGQGVWTTSELLARAAIHEGKYVQSFPEFGPERMGAPIAAFTRIGDEPIRLHCPVYEPDVVVVLDQTLIKTVPVAQELSESGAVVVNSRGEPVEIRSVMEFEGGRVWVVPATELAVRILGRPIMNTAMLGAVARVTGVVSLESLESVVRERFGSDTAEKNISVMREAYKEVKSE